MAGNKSRRRPGLSGEKGMGRRAGAEHRVDGKYPIQDLVDIGRLRTLFEKFSLATGFTTGFVSYPGQEILIATGWRDICTKFHRACPESARHCKESNVCLTDRLTALKELSIRPCENGLVDGATPIIVKGKHIASLATGQVLFQQPDIGRFKKQAERYGYDTVAYLDALREVPVVTEEQFVKVLSFLGELAIVIAEMGLKNLEIRERTESLTKEIDRRTRTEEAVRAALQRSHRQQEVVARIAVSPRLTSGDIHGLAAQLTELAARTMGVERCGVWLFDPAEEELRCVDLYEASVNRHSAGAVLREHEYANEFEALRTAKYVDADDPLTDPRTAGYVEGYLTPMRITSMLDAVIRTSGRNLGALCFEHVDRPHHWEQDEVAFACQLADQIALAILNRDSALAGEALRESEERFRTIFDSAKDAIFLETPEGRILDANKAACELLGYTREELLAKRVSDIVPPERAALFPKRIQARTVQKGVYVEVEELRKKGVRIPVEVSNTLVDIGGRQRVVAIVRDIGERKRLEEQLLHAQKMEAVGTLAGGLAHDFNNILAGILGYASLLRALLNENNLPSSDAESIEGLTQRGAAIARSLLAFSRKGAYRPVALSINEVVGSVLQMMAQTAGKQIEIRTKLPEGVSSVIGDEGQLHQALLNLCINACEAMPDGGTLTVETANAKPGRGFFLAHPKTTQGPYVSVAVADTGIGMDAETRARIFEPFFTTKADTTGTGLGLPMALGIVERHGGCIEVESASGEGSRFTMYLPATRRKAREVRRKPVGTLRGDETILVVDDEDGFRDGTSRWLRELGYTVIEAASGAEALRIIRKKKDKIKLVLLDMIMKGPSGTETFARMRKLSPGTAVVICTGYSIDAKCQRALRSGASGIILKPLEADRIALKIRQILDDR